MARNKYPEQTIKKILDTSLRLFSEKGYEQTTIQDIVHDLGMSKGAIYHHFKSKEEILLALGNHYYNDHAMFGNIKERDDLTGLEKIREIFVLQLSNQSKADMDVLTINIWKDPKFFMMDMKNNLTENPLAIMGMLEEGMADGSIRKQDAKCLAQVVLMLVNYWVLSPITGFSPEDLKTKIHYLRFFTDAIGLPIIDDHVEQLAFAYFDRLAQSI